MSIYQLEQDVRAEIIERANELKESDDPSDLLVELADSHIPIYNHELAKCLAGDPGLAYVDDDGLIDMSKGVYHVIQVAIYERLIQTAHEAYDNLPECDAPEKIDLIALAVNICDPSGINLGAMA